ncbi:MAG: cache domain-containing protein, partial [Bacteroidales bacterium]|nr:cache domain-containing protein [Bacteroidales bacterium]
MKLKQKLPLILSISLIFSTLLLNVFYYIHQYNFITEHIVKHKQHRIDNLKSDIKEKANIVYQMLKVSIADELKTSLENAELERHVLELNKLPSMIMFNSYQNLWISDLNEPYTIILDTENPKLEGSTQLLLLPDTKENIYEKYQEIIYNYGEDFFEYNLKSEDNKSTIQYISYIKLLPEKDWIIGLNSTITHIINETDEEDQALMHNLQMTSLLLVAIGFLISFGFSYLLYFFTNKHSSALNKIASNLKLFINGKKTAVIDYDSIGEIGEMKASVDTLIGNFERYINFAHEIEKGNLQEELHVFNSDDVLGNRLNNLRISLAKAEKLEELRKEEILIRNWANEGYALFGDILRRDQDNTDVLAYDAISNIV